MNLKKMSLGMLLAGIALVGPLVAYAGVSVIYPSSQHTANVNAAPPITFDEGDDRLQAAGLGFAGALTQTNNDASFTITLSGLSGGSVTIDNYAEATATDKVTSFKLQVADALSGTLTAPTTLKIRVWDPAVSAVAPTADGDANVCAYLSLKDAADTESSGPGCDGDAAYNIQVIYTLPNASSGSSTVSIRPSSIVFV